MVLTWANQITVLRIFLIAPFVICMIKANAPDTGRLMRYTAIGIFIFMCISDVLDGYMARVKKQVTTLGAFLDPLADKLLMTCACVLLTATKTAIKGFELPAPVVVFIIGKDMFLLLGFTIVYLVTSQVRIESVWIGKLAAFLQLSMVASVLIAPEVSSFFPGWVLLTRFVWYSAAGAAILATIIYIRTGIRYIGEFETK